MDNRERLLRKIAATSTARKIGFSAGGAGTFMLGNAALGNNSLASYILSGLLGTGAGLGAEYGLSVLEDKNGWSYPGSITGGSTAQGPIHVPAMDIKVPDVPMDYTGTAVMTALGMPIAGAKTVRDRWKAHADARKQTRANKAVAEGNVAKAKAEIAEHKKTGKPYSRKSIVYQAAEKDLQAAYEAAVKEHPELAKPGKRGGFNKWKRTGGLRPDPNNPHIDLKRLGQYEKVRAKGSWLKSGAKNMLIPIIMGALGFGADYARNAALNRDTGL